MRNRINSIDVVRGLVMVLMAIDHVRLYGGIPAGGAEPVLFFTRWITHFCVSGFVFFAGAGIFLHARKINDKSSLAAFLIIRGLLLVVLELTVIRFCWTFNFNFNEFILAGVIWMLGWCMVLMAALIRLPVNIVGITGLIIVFCQQLFSGIPALFGPAAEKFALFWNVFYPSGYPGSEQFAILYTIIPWIGVMATGYWFGKFFLLSEEKRDKIFTITGIVATSVFIIIGSVMILLNEDKGSTQPFIFRLLNQNKYPASQLFLLMTLGPLILLLPWAEKSKSKPAGILVVFGRVPFFYYLLHVLLIHVLALLVNFLRSGNMHQDWYGYAPFYTQKEVGIRWTLPLLYFVFLIAEIILYFFCKWYMNYKINHPEKRWLKYL